MEEALCGQSDCIPNEVPSESLDDLFRMCPSRHELVKLMEGYSVKTLVELPERKLIGLLDSLQASGGLGFLDYSCILKAIWWEKRFLYEGSKRRELGSGGVARRFNTGTAAMDADLWSMLPEHLLDRILACLPLPSLLCMRPVCKRWSTLLSTPSFLELCNEVPQQPSLLALFEKGEHGWLTQGSCSAFCSAAQRWYTIALGPLPFHEGDQLAAAEGLICYIPLVDGENDDCLVVCNPLTRAWKSIPLPDSIQMLSLLAITVDPASRAYKLIVTALTHPQPEAPRQGHTHHSLATQVYDSRTQTWTLTGRLPPGLHFPLHAVLCDGRLYGWCSKADQIWVYDIAGGAWRGVSLALPDEARTANLHVVVCRRRVMLVTEPGCAGLRPQIWELDAATMACTEVARVPPPLFHSFFENVCDFQCVGSDHAVCFVAQDCPAVLAYHIPLQRWAWLPRCPLVPDWHPYGHAAVALKLSLDVAV